MVLGVAVACTRHAIRSGLGQADGCEWGGFDMCQALS